MSALALFLATVAVAADTGRCESGHRWLDAEVVLQTARNRAAASGESLLHVLLRPAQYAQGCPNSPRTWAWRHLDLGVRAVTGQLDAPAWANTAVHFAGPSDPDPEELCARWGVVPVGKVVHTFCARAGRR